LDNWLAGQGTFCSTGSINKRVLTEAESYIIAF